MDFEKAWRYLMKNSPISLRTSGNTDFIAKVYDDSISYKSRNDQERPQSKENFRIYFDIWFKEGRKESKYFPNFGERQSPSARYRYFSSVFRYLDTVKDKI